MQTVVLYDGKKDVGFAKLDRVDLPTFVERIHPDDYDMAAPSVYGKPMVEAREQRVQRFYRVGTTNAYRLEGT